MSSITTTRGDTGETDLMYGRRVSKTDPRVAACGDLDELNASLGLARTFSTRESITTWIARLQRELILVMGELMTLPEDMPRYEKAGFTRVTPSLTDALHDGVREIEASLTRFKDWAIPGENASSCAAALDVARTVSRRAERSVWSVPPDNPEIPRYLNRLADLLWLLARLETALGRE